MLQLQHQNCCGITITFNHLLARYDALDTSFQTVTVIKSDLSSPALSPCSPSQRGGRFLAQVIISTGRVGHAHPPCLWLEDKHVAPGKARNRPNLMRNDVKLAHCLGSPLS